jgi:hypothetical protein
VPCRGWITHRRGDEDVRAQACLAAVPALRDDLTTSLGASLRRRLLQPGAPTSSILKLYVGVVKVLQILDPTGICHERVGEPVRHYLRCARTPRRCTHTCTYTTKKIRTDPQRLRGAVGRRERSDTVRCIVESLTTTEADDALAHELRADGAAKRLPDGDDVELSDYEDAQWMPDPIDADLGPCPPSCVPLPPQTHTSRHTHHPPTPTPYPHTLVLAGTTSRLAIRARVGG